MRPPINTHDSTTHHYDIHIAEDGRWYHEGGEIKRLELVRLFASVLSCVDGQYWLRTPAEAGIITVAEAPFLITSCDIVGDVSGREQRQTIIFQDNLQRSWTLGPDHQLEVRQGPMAGEPRPFLHLDKGLTARINRPVFYQLAEMAERNAEGHVGVWSGGNWFSLEIAS